MVRKRAEQLEYIQDIVLKGHDALVMGDFNFDYKWEGEPEKINWDVYCDIWQELKDPSEPSHTMNQTSYYNPVTFDHILLSKDSQFRPEFISRVGNFCCRNFPEEDLAKTCEDSKIRTPSDHLGLYAVIVVKQ